ncbi:glycosyltransferase family 2 protein [uncultured Actinobacillus sp.]|uniref:glycosyltransferase family 2 protein n=1 Tax=uncultured Actinobacillus sp. TaxID=417616 RepID=UPI0025DB7435|nr:glycosyltransferase family 2 protein [uncultured Actinobacillus sp.]
MISIVVPVYNVEQYLDYCVESLVNQTYKNIEILLIDDGSSDNSGKIADEWAKKDKRIRVFHKENGGLSDSRNYGVAQAKSEWIMFIDSDDYYDLFAVEYFVRIQEKYNADLVVSALKGVTNHKPSHRDITENDITAAYPLSNEKALEEMFYSLATGPSACGKLFKKELLIQDPYPKGKLYEDIATTYKQVYKANNIYVAPIKVYGYFKRDGSIVNSKFDERYLYVLDIIDNIYIFLETKYPSVSELKLALDIRNVLTSMQIANSMLMAEMFPEVKKIQERVSVYKKEFLVNKNVSWKNKLKFLLFLTYPKLYNYLRVSLLK